MYIRLSLSLSLSLSLPLPPSLPLSLSLSPLLSLLFNQHKNKKESQAYLGVTSAAAVFVASEMSVCMPRSVLSVRAISSLSFGPASEDVVRCCSSARATAMRTACVYVCDVYVGMRLCTCVGRSGARYPYARCVYACMYMYVYVCMYVCMYVSMYAILCVCVRYAIFLAHELMYAWV
jgi:hypothetical protein